MYSATDVHDSATDIFHLAIDITNSAMEFLWISLKLSEIALKRFLNLPDSRRIYLNSLWITINPLNLPETLWSLLSTFANLANIFETFGI